MYDRSDKAASFYGPLCSSMFSSCALLRSNSCSGTRFSETGRGGTKSCDPCFMQLTEHSTNLGVYIAPSKAARVTSAYELVDWFHFVDVPLGAEELTRLTAAVERLYSPAIHDFFEGIPPGYGLKLDHPALTTHLTK